MEPGRELDAKIAIEVMGWSDIKWSPLNHNKINDPVGIAPGEVASSYTGYRPSYPVPRFSTDISAAWEVRDAVSKLVFSKRCRFTEECRRLISEEMQCEGIHHSEVILRIKPHHICLAALSTIE